jgi:subtilisin family serine protease
MFAHKAGVILALTWATTAAAQPAQEALHLMRPQRVDRGLPVQLESQLQQLVDASAAPPSPSARTSPLAALSVAPDVPVTIRFEGPPDAIETALTSLAIQPVNRRERVIEAYVPVALLPQVAAIGAVQRVALIQAPRPHAISQGASVHNAASWQTGGQNGAGVKVGVIDLGFLGLTTLLGSELPASVTARCYTGLGTFTTTPFTCDTDTPHGAAVAEALFDIAPGVDLYVANPQSPLDLRSTVEWMTSLGVRIINHSVGWTWTGPGDGTSPFDDAPLRTVDVAVNAGIVWVNAAGNDALATWTGSLSDADGDGWQEFRPQCPDFGGCEMNAVGLQVGKTFVAQMRWDDTWTSAARDLDLYLMEWNPTAAVLTPVAVSANVQGGMSGQVPLEVLTYTPPFDCACSYFLAFSRFAGTIPSWVQVQSFTGEAMQYATLEGSISNPAETANPGALAVGAAPWYDPGAIELFSSRGPTRDGRDKPDLIAADRGDSTSFGAGGFVGTSQAAPHVSGLAALVLGSFPDTPPLPLTKYLRTLAEPRGPARAWGSGFAHLPTFPEGISVSALLSDATLPARRGQSISWRAFAIGTSGPFEYQFWVHREGSGWRIGRRYGSSNVFTWSPPASGTYNVLALARRVGSRAVQEAWRMSEPLVVEGALPLTLTSLTSDSLLPRAFGTSITWTAEATGGLPPLQYEFWRFRRGGELKSVQGYSASNTYTWTPGPGDMGTYTLVALVRSSGSQALFEAVRVFGPFRIVAPSTTTGLEPDAPAEAGLGTERLPVSLAEPLTRTR